MDFYTKKMKNEKWKVKSEKWKVKKEKSDMVHSGNWNRDLFHPKEESYP